jgi:hypothetical protein
MGFRLSGNIDLKIVSNIADYEPYLDYEDSFSLSEDFLDSRHYNPKKIREAERKRAEVTLYGKILEDERLKLTPESQSLSFSEVLGISSDYSEYMGKYIFLNGLRLIKDKFPYYQELKRIRLLLLRSLKII